jgi:twitching motility protein PilT
MPSGDPGDAPGASQPSTAQPTIQELLAYFGQAGRMRVSDLHLKIGVSPTYRVDGALEKSEFPPLDRKTMDAIVASLLTSEDLRRLRTHFSWDGSHTTDLFQFRLNFLRDNDGIAGAIRAFDLDIPPADEIGFPNDTWKDIVQLQQGLVLITGITGAGKSTTIASLVDRIARERACRIITLEDPIEYLLPSRKGLISQREVGRDVPSFELGLRDCLREDPDIIFVGEMRDRESAAWTLTAAETGHLVLSTLHTRDSRGTITRILDMWPAEKQDEVANQLSLGLAYIITQRLVPRADGRGRLVAMEILRNNYAVANLIRTRKLEQLYTQMQTRTRNVAGQRMVTMERALALLAASGRVTAAEAEKWANDRKSFLDEMSHFNRTLQ